MPRDETTHLVNFGWCWTCGVKSPLEQLHQRTITALANNSPRYNVRKKVGIHSVAIHLDGTHASKIEVVSNCCGLCYEGWYGAVILGCDNDAYRGKPLSKIQCENHADGITLADCGCVILCTPDGPAPGVLTSDLYVSPGGYLYVKPLKISRLVREDPWLRKQWPWGLRKPGDNSEKGPE